MRVRAGLPTGVTALLFEAARDRRRLEARLAGVLERCGFSEALLPILDYCDPYEPLLRGGAHDELYRFVDRDGHLLALRGDFTPMLARLLAPHLERLEVPLRVFYRGDVVRYQEAHPGRLREYSQLGAELIAPARPEYDEEVVTLFLELLTRELERANHTVGGGDPDRGGRGIDLVLGVAGALDNFLRAADDPVRLALALARREREAARTQHPALLEIVERGVPARLEALGDSAPRVAELIALAERLAGRYAALGVRVRVDLAEFATETVDPALADGNADRAYYDGPLFVAYLDGLGQEVGSGGRYDRLFGRLGAPQVGAAGFSIALDVLLEATEGDAAETATPSATRQGATP